MNHRFTQPSSCTSVCMCVQGGPGLSPRGRSLTCLSLTNRSLWTSPFMWCVFTISPVRTQLPECTHSHARTHWINSSFQSTLLIKLSVWMEPLPPLARPLCFLCAIQRTIVPHHLSLSLSLPLPPSPSLSLPLLPPFHLSISQSLSHPNSMSCSVYQFNMSISH